MSNKLEAGGYWVLLFLYMDEIQPKVLFEWQPKIASTLATIPWLVPVLFFIGLSQESDLSSEAKSLGFLIFVGGGLVFAVVMSLFFGTILHFANKKAFIRVFEDGTFQSTIPTQCKLPASEISKVEYKPWGWKGRLLVYTKSGRKILVVFSTKGFADQKAPLRSAFEKFGLPVEGV